MLVRVLLTRPDRALSAPCPTCLRPCYWAAVEPGAVFSPPSGHIEERPGSADPPDARRLICPDPRTA